MAITADELQQIINAVLSSIRTNSRTIDQLSLATTLSDDNCFEVSGGKRVLFALLKKTIEEKPLTEIESLKNLIKLYETAVNNLRVSIDAINNNIIELDEFIKLANSSILSIEGSIGQPNGIAPLNESGQISSRYLPGSVDDVKEFSKIDSDVAVSQETTSHSSEDDGYTVVYDSSNKVFVLYTARTYRPETGVTPAVEIKPYYFADWGDGDAFGVRTDIGRRPVSDKLYVDVSTNKVYRWSGTNLSEIPTGVALGYTPETAFPGNEGKELSILVKTLQQTVEKIQKLGVTLPKFYDVLTDVQERLLDDGSTEMSSTSDNCHVVYMQQEKCFRLFVYNPREDPLHNKVYYRRWADMDSFGTVDQDGRCHPQSEQIYHFVSESGDVLCYWNSTDKELLPMTNTIYASNDDIDAACFSEDSGSNL